MAKYLVIVESPAKAKTINKFLGKEYEVVASMGHLIDLPRSRMGIDVAHDFKAEYIVIPDRKKNLESLKKAADGKIAVYLCPDPDREGEAIAWHIRNALEDKEKKFYRVTFDEITEHAVKEAFQNPRDVDIQLVNAQQARRILDRIVGYNLSPLLWKKVSRGLSAGRVQSVAVRIVVDREREIQQFVPQEYWEIDADLKRPEDEVEERFKAKLATRDGAKFEITDKATGESALEELKRQEFIVDNIKGAKKKKNPFPPFTTSKLQQEAFNKLRYPVNKTMHIAQMLYEGVELGGEGAVGLITYMRTDSVRISKDGVDAAKVYILEKYGKRYYPETPNVYKSKKTAQEAHEAIRPTLPLRSPESVRDFLTPEQLKLYELVWNRFLASQMVPALYGTTSVDIKAGRFGFKASDAKVIFDGFMAIYGEVELDEEEKKAKSKLPELIVGARIDLLSIIPSQHFTKPPARYSDASLVKALEEKGIGRPSTYAPIIGTIITRGYVTRDAGYFKATELGFIVTDLLVAHFPTIIDEKFTAKMEDELDGIEAGEIDYLVALKSFYSPFMHLVTQAGDQMKNVKREVIPTDQICEMCSKPMVVKWGRRGKFLSCSDYPRCKNAKSITTGVKCPQEGCTGELIARRSKRGSFYGCSRYPNCTFTSKKLPETAEGQAGAPGPSGASPIPQITPDAPSA